MKAIRKRARRVISRAMIDDLKVGVRPAIVTEFVQYSRDESGVFTASGVVVGIELTSTDGVNWKRKVSLDQPNRYGGLGHWADRVPGSVGIPACRHSVSLAVSCPRCRELRAMGDEMPTELRGVP